MKHGGDGGADADDADPSGGADLPLFREKMLRQPGKQGKPHHDGEAHAHERQIVQDLFPKIGHWYHLKTKVRPGYIPRA